MAHKDWVPRKEAELADLCRQWALLLGYAANTTRWGWDTNEVTPTLSAINTFISVRETYEGNKSELKRIEKDGKKKIAVAKMRDFANTSIRFNKKMDDADRLAFGIHPKDMEPTKHGPPKTAPEVIAKTDVIRHLTLLVRDPGTKSWGKPDGVAAIQLRWAILDHRPEHIDELVNWVSVTANPIELPFDENDRGKRVYFTARWVNSTGGVGPWSDIESAFIP